MTFDDFIEQLKSGAYRGGRIVIHVSGEGVPVSVELPAPTVTVQFDRRMKPRVRVADTAAPVIETLLCGNA